MDAYLHHRIFFKSIATCDAYLAVAQERRALSHGSSILSPKREVIVRVSKYARQQCKLITGRRQYESNVAGGDVLVKKIV